MASSSETIPIGSALASSAARQSSPEKSKKISKIDSLFFFFNLLWSVCRPNYEAIIKGQRGGRRRKTPHQQKYIVLKTLLYEDK